MGRAAASRRRRACHSATGDAPRVVTEVSVIRVSTMRSAVGHEKLDQQSPPGPTLSTLDLQLDVVCGLLSTRITTRSRYASFSQESAWLSTSGKIRVDGVCLPKFASARFQGIS